VDEVLRSSYVPALALADPADPLLPAHAAQTSAYDALVAALAAALELGGTNEVVEIIEYAMGRVACPDGSPEISASALNATSRALASMDKLRKYVVENLLDVFPSSVPQFLWNNPF
jgi:hypothetical protein